MNDRWGRRFFVAGGIWLVLIGLVHALSLIGKQVPANDTEKQLLELMANYRFDLMGSMRSMGELLRGFSIAFLLAALVMGALDLVLSRERAGLLKRVALVNVIWLAAMTGVAVRYFFVLPTSFLAIALVLFALAWFGLPADASAPKETR
jgi:hypothetical protein